jgi:hypothetical protein
MLVHIHLDVCGKMQMKSHTKYEYFMTLIDNASQMLDLVFLKEKSKALNKFTAFVERVS